MDGPVEVEVFSVVLLGYPERELISECLCSNQAW
jgi:hypothetical protein